MGGKRIGFRCSRARLQACFHGTYLDLFPRPLRGHSFRQTDLGCEELAGKLRPGMCQLETVQASFCAGPEPLKYFLPTLGWKVVQFPSLTSWSITSRALAILESMLSM